MQTHTHTVTTRTYFVPTSAYSDPCWDTTLHLAKSKVSAYVEDGPRVTGIGLDPAGNAEALVTVTGDERVHGAMLDRFAWTGE